MTIKLKFHYILSLFFVFIVPLFFEGHFIYQQIDTYNLIAFIVGITIIGSLWDIWATKHGVKDSIWIWQFNKKDIIGITFFDLPIEEYLFYIATSTYIIFTWKLMESGNVFIPTVATLWSLFFIGLPYINRFKKQYKN
ncbi:MAG: lycopene cyclase domain-containing protein [Candidatus Pacebacteria bacterium]|nr:lycopene cyclase domain-containing protein [Candidatus Paceibacterota bacterium]